MRTLKTGGTIAGPYSGLWTLTSDQSSTSGAVTTLSGFTAQFDNGTFYSGGSPTRFTIPATGRYIVCASIKYNSSTVGNRICRLHKNGSYLYNLCMMASTVSGDDPVASGSIVLSLASSDYLSLCSYQTSGGSLNVIGGTFASANPSCISIAYLAGQ